MIHRLTLASLLLLTLYQAVLAVDRSEEGTLRWQGRTAGELREAAMRVEDTVPERSNAVRGLGELAIFDPVAEAALRTVALSRDEPVALWAAEALARRGVHGGEVMNAVLNARPSEQMAASNVIVMWSRQAWEPGSPAWVGGWQVGLAMAGSEHAYQRQLGAQVLEAVVAISPHAESEAALARLADRKERWTAAWATLGLTRVSLREGGDDAFVLAAEFIRMMTTQQGPPVNTRGEVTPFAERFASLLEDAGGGRDLALVLAAPLDADVEQDEDAAAWALFAHSYTGPTATVKLAVCYDDPRTPVQWVARSRLTALLDAGVVNTDPDAVDPETVQERVVVLPTVFSNLEELRRRAMPNSEDEWEELQEDWNAVADPIAGLGVPAVQRLIVRLKADGVPVDAENGAGATDASPAVRALMRMGGVIRLAILEKLRGETDTTLCLYLVEIWSQIIRRGGAGDDPYEPLLVAMHHPSESVRAEAGRRMFIFARRRSMIEPGPQWPPVPLVPLAEAVRDGTHVVRVDNDFRGLVEAMQMRLGLEAEAEKTRAMRVVLQGELDEAMMPALHELERMDPAVVEPLRPDLMRLAEGERWWVAGGAIRVLFCLDPRRDELVALAERYCHAEEVPLRVASLLVLSHDPDAGEAAAVEAVRMAIDPGEDGVPYTLAMLPLMRQHAAAMAVPLLEALRQPPDPADEAAQRAVQHALQAVHAIAPEDEELVDAVSAILVDDRWPRSVRWYASPAVASMGPAAEPYAGLIVELYHTDGRNQSELLFRMGNPAITHAAVAYLLEGKGPGPLSDEVVRMLPLAGPHAAAVPALLERLTEVHPAPGTERRGGWGTLGVIDALAAIGPGARDALPVLRLYAHAKPPADHPNREMIERWSERAAAAVAAVEAD